MFFLHNDGVGQKTWLRVLFYPQWIDLREKLQETIEGEKGFL
jgi:hypothetical protein